MSNINFVKYYYGYLSRTARIYGNLPMISPEVKSFDSFVARMGEGKGQILTFDFTSSAVA
jgi:hypothetical protein